MLIAGLFGHRRPDDPAYVQWYHNAAHWTTDHWQVLAVVIPVAGALVAGYFNHALAVSRENRARRLSLDDVRMRVHADLAARLLRHCSEVRHALQSPADPSNWRAGNAALKERAERGDVVEALGPSYVSFMAAIEAERRILGELVAMGVRAEEPAQGRASYVARGAYRILKAYAPFVAQFGEAEQARRLDKYANDAFAEAVRDG